MEQKNCFGVESVYIFGSPSNLYLSDSVLCSSNQDFYRINVITSFDLKDYINNCTQEVFSNVLNLELRLIGDLPEPQKSFNSYLFNNHLSKERYGKNIKTVDLLNEDLEYELKSTAKGYVNFLFINMESEEMYTCTNLFDLYQKINMLLWGSIHANHILEEKLGFEFTKH